MESAGFQDVCVHPGWEIFTAGLRSVRRRAIFASSAYMRFNLTDVEVTRMANGLESRVENLYTVHEGVTASQNCSDQSLGC